MERKGKDSQKERKLILPSVNVAGLLHPNKNTKQIIFYIEQFLNLAFLVKNICYNHCGNAVYNQP